MSWHCNVLVSLFHLLGLISLYSLSVYLIRSIIFYADDQFTAKGSLGWWENSQFCKCVGDLERACHVCGGRAFVALRSSGRIIASLLLICTSSASGNATVEDQSYSGHQA